MPTTLIVRLRLQARLIWLLGVPLLVAACKHGGGPSY